MTVSRPNPFCYKAVERAISTYAEAYRLIEAVQSNPADDDQCTIPKGDQKTGCIGEFWAMRYARKRWTDSHLSFGHHSQHGWDILVKGKHPMWIQVKTVSGWAEQRGLSPLHNPSHRPENAPADWKPWTHLWILYLSQELIPAGLWQFESSEIDFAGATKLTGLKIPNLEKKRPGSGKLKWPKNSVAHFRATIGECSLFADL